MARTLPEKYTSRMVAALEHRETEYHGETHRIDVNCKSDLEVFESIARERAAVRHFLPKPVSEALLLKLLELTQLTPSSFNLQPTHFYVIADRQGRAAIREACMDQHQVEEAPYVVIFAGDRRVYENNASKILARDLAEGHVSLDYARHLKWALGLQFEHGVLGLGWLWKLAGPLVSYIRPVPEFPAVHKRFWLSKQVSLSAMTFMLAAEAAGLDTIPMEGFDPRRLRKAANLPAHMEPILVIPVGYGVPSHQKSRLPLSDVLHVDEHLQAGF